MFGSPRAALFFATAWSLGEEGVVLVSSSFFFFLKLSLFFFRSAGSRSTKKKREKNSPFFFPLFSSPFPPSPLQPPKTGYGAGTIDSWLFVFLEEPPLRASKQLMGVTILVTCATEVPAFFFAGRLIEKFGSGRVLSVVSLVLAGRLLGYWFLPRVAPHSSPWAVLPLETLNGVTFGCGWAAGTARAASLAPPGLAATAQAAFAAVYGGLGAGLGSLAGGVVRSRAGGARAVFAAAAAVVGLSWAATAVAEIFVKRSEMRKRRRSTGGGAAATLKQKQKQQLQQRKGGFQRWPSLASSSLSS